MLRLILSCLFFYLSIQRAESSEAIRSIQFIGDPSFTIKVGVVSVPIYKEATLTNANEGLPETKLHLTGAGIRRKRLGFFDVDVYVISSYSEFPQGLPKEDPLGAIQLSQNEALYLTMVRDVTSQTIRSSFEDSLEANAVSLKKPGISELLKKINFNMPISESVVFIGTETDGLDTVVVETTLGHWFQVQDSNLPLDFWRIWFGIPVDRFMEALKKKLLGEDLAFK